ncbi:MAG: type VI secretion system baseplate subunit TssK [Desulfovibrio sp.]|nr:type VI secretion system baseplate subunit TssK [Desulfovibrio sp.]
MKGHRPVFWNQGLFLHPQHFQAADEETRRLIEPLRQFGLPFFWGVRRLVWRDVASQSSLEIENLEAVFPSGAVVNVPFDAALRPLALDAKWPEPDRPCLLYLGLALPQTGGANAAPEGERDGKRFVYAEEPENLPDMYGAGAPAPVQRLRYAPVLIRDSEKKRYTNFEMLPIALVRRIGEHIELDAHFLPPLLCLDANQHLSGLVREVEDMALSCANRLSGYKSIAADDNASAGIDFVLNFTALGILNRYIPLLAHLRAAPGIHPWRIYGALLQMLGELSTFYDNVDCLGRGTASGETLPDYNHESPGECFGAVCGLVKKLMADLHISAAKTLPLLPEPPYFSADIPENFLSVSCKYWIMVHVEHLTETMADNFPRLAKLGTRQRLNTIIAKAVSGVPLTKARSAPPVFTRGADTAWYVVDTAHPLWQNITDEGKVSLFWEGAPNSAQISLVATGR